MNTNLAQILQQETITSTTTWITPSVEPGQQTWRVMCQIITNELDEGERDYAVPLDSQTIDLVMTTEPCWSSVEQALEEAGWDMNQWRLMDWWQPETDGVADAF